MATQLSGKVGQLIYRQTKYGTVVYEAPTKASVPQRTEAQMQVRTQWGNMAAVYRQFNQTLKKGFEGLNGKMNDYNAFIQANTNVVKVYVPKSVRLNGGSVLAPYQITRGTLPSVAMVKNSGGGSQTVTVAAPTFSGETQFTESTQVTMSGPAGASIFYTVDGSTPTDQSLEYEEPITLSATTTVKAIAIKDGVSSSVTSRTYTKSAGGGDDEPGGDDH